MISIIIPTFNEEKYLGKLLESIKTQTLFPGEIIVADNKSLDDTRKLARDFGCKVVEGGNPAVGRNIGARASKGDVMLFLDSDVIMPDKNFLKRLIKKFNNKKADVAVCYFSSKEKGIFLSFHKLFVNVTKKLQEIFVQVFGFTLGDFGTFILVKRKAFDDVGGFNEELMVLEDIEFFQKLARKGYGYRVLSEKIIVSGRRAQVVGMFSYMKLLIYISTCSFCGLIGLNFPEKAQMRYAEIKGEMGGGRG